MRGDRAYLLDMLNAARDAQTFTSDITFEQFQQSLLHQMATLKAIEIIGEAASRLSEEFKGKHPEIPWRAIVGMRNRLVHGYFEVDYQRVWDTVQQDLPELIEFLEDILRHDSDNDAS